MGEAHRLMSGALKLNPQMPDAWMNLANGLHALKRDAEALDCLDKAQSRRPGDTNALQSHGNALAALGHYEALTAFDSLDRHAEAVASFDKAIELQKNNADAHFNRALSLLTLGDLAHGFEQYEWRWQRSGMRDTRRGYGKPLWLGEYPIARKTTCCMPNRDWATPSSLRATPRCWRAPARPSCWKSRRN